MIREKRDAPIPIPKMNKTRALWRTWTEGILDAFGHASSEASVVVVHFCPFQSLSIHSYTHSMCVENLVSQAVPGTRNSRERTQAQAKYSSVVGSVGTM